jgi:hypothetical protein
MLENANCARLSALVADSARIRFPQLGTWKLEP